MPTRELFAIAALPIVVVVVVWLPAWAFLAVVAAASVIAGDELLRMARGRGIPCGRGLPLAALAGVMAAAWVFGTAGLTIAATATLMVVPTAHLARRSGPEGRLTGVAVACFAVLFLGVAAASLGWLRLRPSELDNARFVLFYLGTIWIGDSGAYYVGKQFGRHRMSPRVSPNKTWEGLAGGVLATAGGAALLNVLFGVALPWPHVAAVAAILMAVVPVGDLVESQFKRDTQVKDSSSLIPGHGGMLDRTDSLFYAAPWVLGYLLSAGLMR